MSKIILITNNDFAGTLFLNRLSKYELDIGRVYLVSAIRGNIFQKTQKTLSLCVSRSMIFLWYKSFVERFLFKFLSVDEKSIKSIKRLCREKDITLERVYDVNDPGFIAKINEQKDALILSAYGTQVFNSELVSRAGTLWNVHGSYLPFYRGAAAYFWMLMKDEDPRGVTIHEVVQELDAGRVIMRAVINPNWKESLYSYHARCVLEAAELFVKAYRKYNEQQERFYNLLENVSAHQRPVVGLPKRGDIREFKKRGKHFFYWNDFKEIKGRLN